VQTLGELRELLIEELGSHAELCFINTRLILATGVSLDDSRVYPADGGKRAARVADELHKMGFLNGAPAGDRIRG